MCSPETQNTQTRLNPRPNTHLSQIQTGRITTVIIIPVHVQHLLPVDRQEAGQDALGEAGALCVSTLLASWVQGWGQPACVPMKDQASVRRWRNARAVLSEGEEGMR